MQLSVTWDTNYLYICRVELTKIHIDRDNSNKTGESFHQPSRVCNYLYLFRLKIRWKMFEISNIQIIKY
jgi:hypothetical protein